MKDVSGLHWSDVSGGVQAPAPRPFLHGYVMCDAMVQGSIAHSCAHGPGPHSIKVCITRKYNEKIFDELLKLAPPRPPRPAAKTKLQRIG
ncbi:MAG TPA: hypothetical protein VKT30_00025 [Caulobacteraceae bacterium]|nr:hypothetical protein [Caulobacteraceae bacterium]